MTDSLPDNRERQVIYIGQDLPRLSLTRGSLFINGYPHGVVKAVQEAPAAACLFVPLDEYLSNTRYLSREAAFRQMKIRQGTEALLSVIK